MEKFITRKLVALQIESGDEAVRVRYRQYMSKKCIKEIKEATDKEILKEESIAFLVLEQQKSETTH